MYQQLLFLEENDRAMDEDVEEQMDWLQIDPYILEGNVGKVSLPPNWAWNIYKS